MHCTDQPLLLRFEGLPNLFSCTVPPTGGSLEEKMDQDTQVALFKKLRDCAINEVTEVLQLDDSWVLQIRYWDDTHGQNTPVDIELVLHHNGAWEIAFA